jgi:hypothetical protein
VRYLCAAFRLTLQSLDLSGCTSIIPREAAKHIGTLTNLEILDLEEWATLDEESLGVMIWGTPELAAQAVEGWTESDDAVDEHHDENADELPCDNRGGPEAFQGIESSVYASPVRSFGLGKLRILVLSRCEEIGDGAVKNICMGLQRLEEVDLDGTSVSDRGLTLLVKHLGQRNQRSRESDASTGSAHKRAGKQKGGLLRRKSKTTEPAASVASPSAASSSSCRADVRADVRGERLRVVQGTLRRVHAFDCRNVERSNHAPIVRTFHPGTAGSALATNENDADDGNDGNGGAGRRRRRGCVIV